MQLSSYSLGSESCNSSIITQKVQFNRVILPCGISQGIPD